MEYILGNAIFPHPPIIIPAVGKENLEKAKATVEGCKKAAQKVVDSNPQTLIIITPHGPIFQDALILWDMPNFQGNLANFGASQVALSLENNLKLVEEIISQAKEDNILAVKFSPQQAEHYGIESALDHGCLVPLYYLREAGFQGKIVVVSIGFLPLEELYAFGEVLRKAVEKIGERVVIVTSGDLSHRLTKDAPGGYHSEAKDLDKKIVQAVEEGRPEDLVNLDRDLIEKGGECGLRPLVIGLGTMDGWEIESNVYSYEGPFGVGYMTAWIEPKEKREEKRLKEKFFQDRKEAAAKRRKEESPLVRLARETVETYLKQEDLSNIKVDLPEGFPKKAGVFVSLKKHGALRGCIGTIQPTRNSLEEEIMANALSAALKDNRFFPVERDELEEIVYSVDVLSEPEKIADQSKLDPKKYGVIVRKDHRSGLLLPDLEGVDTVEEQVGIAKEKAGISPEEEVDLYRFTVDRYR